MDYDDLRGLEPMTRTNDFGSVFLKDAPAGLPEAGGSTIGCMLISRLHRFETRVPALLAAMDRIEEAYNEKQRCLGSTTEQLATVLAENKELRARCEAAEADIPRTCSRCSHHGAMWLSDGQMDGLCVTCKGNKLCNWQYRGPQGQKGDGE